MRLALGVSANSGAWIFGIFNGRLRGNRIGSSTGYLSGRKGFEIKLKSRLGVEDISNNARRVWKQANANTAKAMNREILRVGMYSRVWSLRLTLLPSFRGLYATCQSC